MFRLIILFFFSIVSTLVSAQVKVRLFSDQSPESALFTVTNGRYIINKFNGGNLTISKGESAIISRFDGKLAVKSRNSEGFITDSVIITGVTGDDYFSLRINSQIPVKKYFMVNILCLKVKKLPGHLYPYAN